MSDACRQIRRVIVEASSASGHGHIPSCFSVVECLYAIYSVMRHDPNRPDWPERDLFVLSKGHASLGLYSVLSHLGYISADDLRGFGSAPSKLGCHPHHPKVPGVEASTGSLGHGIGIAVGMAMAQKMRSSGRRVYTLVGDGEANEGSVWEAVMVACNLALDTLTIVYDNNQSQGRSLQIRNPAAIFAAHGCEVHEVDGHDVDALRAALLQPQTTVKVIVANTRKGHGAATLTDYFAWHRRSPGPDELRAILEEIDAATV
ncbi:MAG: transketolase [Proteobacteria bacterium]|nr:transketolase [Pseudomonadota bacterium]